MARWKELPAALDARERRLVAELRRLKDHSGLSLAALAGKTGYSRSSWERYLNGKQPVPREAVEELAGVCGVDPTRLTVLHEVTERARQAGAVQRAAQQAAQQAQPAQQVQHAQQVLSGGAPGGEDASAREGAAGRAVGAVGREDGAGGPALDGGAALEGSPDREPDRDSDPGPDREEAPGRDGGRVRGRERDGASGPDAPGRDGAPGRDRAPGVAGVAGATEDAGSAGPAEAAGPAGTSSRAARTVTVSLRRCVVAGLAVVVLAFVAGLLAGGAWAGRDAGGGTAAGSGEAAAGTGKTGYRRGVAYSCDVRRHGGDLRAGHSTSREILLDTNSTGFDVVEVQCLLRQHGFEPGATDGLYGPTTKEAVTRFQQVRGLVADGIVGPKTWGELRG
ncbi:helix-turn-helix domain-containing protein [Streptomyces bambusae]|uniref:Helix-turn-helix domain-containing protein n=1 Tax=Streptomyces bambusae TaxID=1550616 RepID=A0ABS6Z1K4_9ACTN|nr:helix-turn-helix domain-containing protein [Streptomyces bambusae]MBW5481269.1 helix-turn-helix domain-containing protein [Streptomyces bambusae]